MTEREIKYLIKLLDKFLYVRCRDDSEYNSAGERQVISLVSKWARYYADDIGLDIGQVR